MVRPGRSRKESMAKRSSKRSKTTSAQVPARTGPAIDPIRVGRAPLGKVRVLDKPLGGVTRAVENRQDENRRRQARMAEVSLSLGRVIEDQRRKGRDLHNAAHSKAISPIEQKARPNVVRNSDYGSLSRTRPNTKTGVLYEPDNKRSPEKVRENPTCKERPSSNRGSGGSRQFVPWCKIKR